MTAVADLILRLSVRDMDESDLSDCSWSDTIDNMRHDLDRVRRGVAEILIVCLPTGRPVGKGEIDYERIAGAGTIWKLGVPEQFRSCGIGSHLIAAAEERILRHGLSTAEIAVRDSNLRALSLYQRLGYVEYGAETTSRPSAPPAASSERNPTTLILLRKVLR